MHSLLTKTGLKKTIPRLTVLKVLHLAKNPLTAEEIYLNCHKYQKSINLSTIYRILDVFLEKGLVIIPFIKDNTTACYTINHHKHKHYLICQECNKIIDIDFCPFTEIANKIENETNYIITNHKFELVGICPNCQNE